MRVKSGNGTTFRRDAPIDFSISGSSNETDVSIFTVDETTGEPTFYLLKKKFW